MARYRGSVEQARRHLRGVGFSAADARKKAPRLSEMWEQQQDSEVKPYEWLGCGTTDVDDSDDFDVTPFLPAPPGA